MKKIEDYLHLYLGCEVIYMDGNAGYTLNIERLHDILTTGNFLRWKPILRPLSDIVQSDYLELYDILNEAEDRDYGEQSDSYKRNYAALNTCGVEYKPIVFKYLLSKHFDLFNLIGEGLALDKTTLK